MSKIVEATEILTALGLPRTQQNERSALTLLALASLRPRSPWKSVRQPLLRIWDIMDFMREVYGKDYAANTRETIRRQTIHQFEQAQRVSATFKHPLNRLSPTGMKHVAIPIPPWDVTWTPLDR